MAKVFFNGRRRSLTKDLVWGWDTQVPLIGERTRHYINLDNAASTPPLREVVSKVQEFVRWYSSVHRGMGFKSQLATEVYEEVREKVAAFVGAPTGTNSVIFVKNTSEAINKVAHSFPFQKGDIVLTTSMEHHSNDLPWRKRAKVIYADLGPSGELDKEDYLNKLKKYGSRIKFVAVTGASNVTGIINDIHWLAKKAHEFGAKILVDGAQLIPHRAINMVGKEPGEELDFLAFSGHKIYAPFGCGVLIGPKTFFEAEEPDYAGGGTVSLVTPQEIIWANSPERNEAGTPNIIGAVALAEALKVLSEIGMDRVALHEYHLTEYALNEIKKIPGIESKGLPIADLDKRVGVIPFNVEHLHHSLVAASLSYEAGIGVRNGCFCAQPYVAQLLGIKERDIEKFRQQVIAKKKEELPGLVRASFGIYNTKEDVAALCEHLESISKGKMAKYLLQEGQYLPQGWQCSREKYFNL